MTHLALLAGEPERTESATVYMPSSCLLGDVLRSARCECRGRLEAAMRPVQREGDGAVFYVERERRGSDMLGEIKAGCSRKVGSGRVGARNRRIADQILKDLRFENVRYVTGDLAETARTGGVY